jgi:hypothetical protein
VKIVIIKEKDEIYQIFKKLLSVPKLKIYKMLLLIERLFKDKLKLNFGFLNKFNL